MGNEVTQFTSCAQMEGMHGSLTPQRVMNRDEGVALN